MLTRWFPSSDRPHAYNFVRDHALALSEIFERVSVLHVVWRERGRRPGIDVTSGPDTATERVMVHRCAVRVGVPATGRPALLTALVRGLVRAMAWGGRPALVNSHVCQSSVMGARLAQALGVPLVVTEHWSRVALGQLSPAQRRRAVIGYRRAELVLVVSEFLRDHVRRLAGDTPVEVVFNPIDEKLVLEVSAGRRRGRGRTSRVVCVTRLVPEKGVDVLLDAAAIARDRWGEEFELVVVGNGPQRRDLGHRARSLGLEEWVAFMGWQPRRPTLELIAGAAVSVVPSRIETFSVVAAESLCLGVPVLATRSGGVEELVDRRSGLLVASECPEEMARAMVTLLNGRERFDRDHIAAAALHRFGRRAFAERFLAAGARAGIRLPDARPGGQPPDGQVKDGSVQAVRAAHKR